jgi:alkanesulfonate monooxygenase SsuD/methylene tetrahydromethanopterin reductase-like flavin-dependent oxidoreductase (luciferase family)
MGCQGRVGLRHVAEYADEWCPLDVGFRDVAKGLQWFRGAVTAAERDPDTIPVSMYCFDQPTAEAVARYAELGIQRVVFSAPDEVDRHHRFLDRCQPLVDEFATPA